MVALRRQSDFAGRKVKEVVLPNMPLLYAVEVVSPQGWTVRLQNTSEIQRLPQLLQALPC